MFFIFHQSKPLFMKTIFVRLSILALCGALFFLLQSHKNPLSSTTTIIILRHAEKDTAAGGDDPILTVAGTEKAERLSAIFDKVVPDAFYSTDYTRTRETLTPWAKQASREIQIYDPANLPDFADMLMKQKGKTIVVAGHSNTVPVLVNLLIRDEKYRALADTEYSKIFVVTIKNGKSKEKIITW